MKIAPRRITFENRHKPGAGFDMIRLEDLHRRTDLDHSPFQLHLVEFYLLILIEAGEGLHTIDFKDYPYQPGTVLTIRKDQIQRFHKNDGVRGTMLLFTNEFLVSYLEELEVMKAFQLFNDVLNAPVLCPTEEKWKTIYSLTRRMVDEYFNVNDQHSLGIIRSELHILLSRLYRLKADNNVLVTERKYLSEFIELQRLVEQHIITHKKVKDYAMMMGRSTKTLNTVTQSILHKSAKAFIDELCTKQIKRLLINTEDSVKEIAFALGFDETTNFYKYFKRQTDLTPEQFRRKV